MKIAICTDNFFPELWGIQDSVAQIAIELAKAGHEVRIYAPKAVKNDFIVGTLPISEIDLGNNISIKRIYSVKFPLSPTLQSRVVLPLGNIYRDLKVFRPDVMHIHTFFGAGLEGLMSAKKLKIPVVGTNHWAILEFWAYVWFFKGLFEKYSGTYVSWFYQHCLFVSAPSQSVIDEMHRFWLTCPTEVISNPIDTELFSPLSPETRLQLKTTLKLSNHTLIFASRLAKEKKIHVILGAIAIVKETFPDVLFLMAGHGSYHPELEQIVKTTGIQKQVRFVWSLNKKELAKLFGASEIFCIASTSETQNMALMQAFACGIPAVGVASRALVEYIHPQENGLLVPPDDPNALAEGIIELFSNPTCTQEMGKNARKYAQIFSSATIATIWQQRYQEIVRNCRKNM